MRAFEFVLGVWFSGVLLLANCRCLVDFGCLVILFICV